MNTEHKTTNADSRECVPLMQSAHLSIYRENTFRITGLPVDATEREIKKHAEKLKLLEELGQGQDANKAAFALNPPPSVEQIRAAMQRLKEPELRLIDEFFWFWPNEFGKSANDPAIQAVLAGDSQKALNIWLQTEKDTEFNFIAWHNIAVLFHTSALDWTTYQILTNTSESAGKKIEEMWKNSFSRWEKVATDDRVWDKIKTRIKDLDDPRLTTGFVRRMRETFPEAQDKINAEVALRFAESGKIGLAKVHIDFMNATNQGLDDVEKTSALVLGPTRKRVLQHIATAKKGIEKNPKNGAIVAQELSTQCKPLQTLFELFHGKDSFHKTELFDEVADTMIDCAVAYQKLTEDNNAFIEILQKSLFFATAMDIRARVQRNIEIGENNVSFERLEPIFELLKKIQVSPQSCFTKFAQMKTVMMPMLLKIAETEGADSKTVETLSDTFAIVLRGIAIDANDEALKTHVPSSFTVALDAIQLAQNLVKDPELTAKLVADSILLKRNMSVHLYNQSSQSSSGCMLFFVLLTVGLAAGTAFAFAR